MGGREARADLPPAPEKPLEFWSYEASPFCRVVRELLCELELPHKVITTARGSGNVRSSLRWRERCRCPTWSTPTRTPPCLSLRILMPTCCGRTAAGLHLVQRHLTLL